MAAVRACGARLLFLAQCSPGLNSAKMAFAKLKTQLRMTVAKLPNIFQGTFGLMCILFQSAACRSNLNAAAGVSN